MIRKNYVIYFFLFIIIQWFFCGLFLSAEEVSSSELGEGLYLENIIKNRASVITEMITVINSKSAVEQKIEAIKVLGTIRAKEAVPILIENISIVASEYVKDLPSLENLYPCVSALIEIGKPASEKLVEKLCDSLPELNRRLYVTALVKIETPKVAKFILDAKIQTVAEKEKLHLKEVLESLDSY